MDSPSPTPHNVRRRLARRQDRGAAVLPHHHFREPPADGKPPVPVRRGARWTTWSLLPLVRHCADRVVAWGGDSIALRVVGLLPIRIEATDGAVTTTTLRVEFETRIGPGVTPRGLAKDIGVRLARQLATLLAYGLPGTDHREVPRGVWVVHSGSETMTWLAANPYHRRSRR